MLRLYIWGILSIMWKQFLKEKCTDMSSQFHGANSTEYNNASSQFHEANQKKKNQLGYILI